MGMTEVADKISVREIGAVMCAVAEENEWRKGKRGYYLATREFFGLRLTVRSKNDKVALTYGEEWRIGFEGCKALSPLASTVRAGQHDANVPFAQEHLDMSSVTIQGRQYGRNMQGVKRIVATVIRPCLISKVSSNISNIESFEKKWTIIRLLSDEWRQYVL